MDNDHGGLTIKGKYALFLRQWPSNWHIAPFTIEGQTFNCVEQWMMYQKATMSGDHSTAQKIMQADHPREHKALGRKVQGYNDGKWTMARYKIVLRGTVEKYRQNPDLLALLLGTGDLTFVEAADYDRIWGIGLSEEDPRSDNPSLWRGENLLGKAITEARAILRAETSATQGHPQ